jgi:short-subunit dehydrogenase
LGKFHEIPLEDHVRVIQTDLLGVIFGSYFAIQQFRNQQFGTLINVASALGKVPAPYYPSYTAAKYGVVGLSAALRQELNEDKLEDSIHVCTVMPMAHDTPFFDHAANYTGHEAAPIPPLYDPEKVVDTLLDLAVDPEDEVVVGGAGKFAVALHNIFPGMVEKMMGTETRKEQMEKAAPAGDTKGALHEPAEVGTEVKAGRKKD